MDPITLWTVRLRPVIESDARFILDLRLDPDRAKHLSPIADDLAAQVEWIRGYKDRELVGREFYFMIESLSGESVGTVRVYDVAPKSFVWGSWMVRRGAPPIAAVEAAVGVYDFGFGVLDREKSRFDVRRANKSVVRFHDRFGATRTGEDETNIYFEMTREQYTITRARYVAVFTRCNAT